jgi:hypothetical protein
MHETTTKIYFNNVPDILIIECPGSNIDISPNITINTNDAEITLKLRGIIYHGRHHFTSQIVSLNGDIWYHDGMTTGQTCDWNGALSEHLPQELNTCKGRSVTLVLYAQDTRT